ncbi:MAG TPA: hypothetical protein VII44_05080 [Puia sp.]
MHTIREQKVIDISQGGFRSSFSSAMVSANQAKRLKISEFISWSVCFAIVSGLTGLMKFLKVGLTMDTVTSILFYLSLAGLAYFIYKIISLSKTPVQARIHPIHELN